MNIKNRPNLDIDKIIKHYSEKDDVEIKYVCTSALGDEAQSMDIFYRDTPHPEFGNRYFGMYFRSTGPLDEQRQLCITNADRIEEAEFGMKEVDGQWHYSQHRHDFHTVGDVSIDGGRAYFRCVGNVNKPTKFFAVKDGKFVENTNE